MLEAQGDINHDPEHWVPSQSHREGVNKLSSLNQLPDVSDCSEAMAQ